MKKIMVLGLSALGLALLSQEQASAWVNCKFGVGLNWNWQSGGNNFLWGAFRNGQPPGPEVAYPGHHHGPQGYGGGMQTFPGSAAPYGPYDFQYFGSNPQNGTNAAGQGTQANPAVQSTTGQQNVSWMGNSLYQPVSYSPAAYGYYNYYNPSQSWSQSNYQSYGPYQVPSYWYGR